MTLQELETDVHGGDINHGNIAFAANGDKPAPKSSMQIAAARERQQVVGACLSKSDRGGAVQKAAKARIGAIRKSQRKQAAIARKSS